MPFKVINPATGKVIREVQPVDVNEMSDIIESTHTAFDGWRKKTFAERAEVLKAVAQYMRDNVEELAPLMTEEMGKPIKEARGEVNKAALCADHYAEHAESYLKTEELPSDATLSYVQYLPLGSILGILPWNAPFWLAFRFLAPALMAGNTCVLKHDKHVPSSGKAIEEVFKKVGAPDNIVRNLHIQTEDIEKAIKHPRVQAVSFTGSDRAGGIVASTAASVIKHSVMELGGSDPALVLADADLEDAANNITIMRIINAGQSCIAAKRVIVEESVYDKFVDMLKERLEKLKMGDPANEDTDIGPIAREDLREGLHRQVTETVKAGARCLLGGEMPEGDGFFYPVTLLADVAPDHTASCEETFGPIMAVMKTKDAEEGLKIANDTPYGLASSVWTTRERGEAMAREIQAGQVAVNGLVKTDPRLPSGGIKRSGFGRELGPHGIREFVNAQQVWIGPKVG